MFLLKTFLYQIHVSLVMPGARDAVAEIEKQKTFLDKTADFLVDKIGRPGFVFLHMAWFALWISINVNLLPFGVFDPFPFGLLTMIVSLEAIFLAIFILISQNRAAQVSDLRSELDYEIDVQAEKRSAEILKLLRTLVHKKRR